MRKSSQKWCQKCFKKNPNTQKTWLTVVIGSPEILISVAIPPSLVLFRTVTIVIGRVAIVVVAVVKRWAVGVFRWLLLVLKEQNIRENQYQHSEHCVKVSQYRKWDFFVVFDLQFHIIYYQFHLTVTKLKKRSNLHRDWDAVETWWYPLCSPC